MTSPAPIPASDGEAWPAPRCPGCEKPMQCYGGSGGYVCCDFKVLVKEGGWFDGPGAHLDDRRLVRNTTRGIRRR
jgi:hypothetical protein